LLSNDDLSGNNENGKIGMEILLQIHSENSFKLSFFKFCSSQNASELQKLMLVLLIQAISTCLTPLVPKVRQMI